MKKFLKWTYILAALAAAPLAGDYLQAGGYGVGWAILLIIVLGVPAFLVLTSIKEN